MRNLRFRVLPNTDPRRSSTRPWMVEYHTLEGQRRRPAFKTRGEAEDCRRRMEAEAANIGSQAMALTSRERMEAAECCRLLKGSGITLKQAVEAALKDRQQQHQSRTMGELFNEFLAYKKKGGVSADYLRDLKSKAGRFVREFGSRKASSFTTREMDAWLMNLSVAPLTRNNHRANLRVLFEYAKTQGFTDQNPVMKTQVVKIRDGKPGVLTPPGLIALFLMARRIAPEYFPALAIQAFAGLRTEEVLRMDWADIHWETNSIEVPATKAKTARARHIAIRENLREWLEPIRKERGRVVPTRYRRWLALFRKEMQRGRHEFPSNGLRHSFASYDYEAGKSAERTAADLGHASTTMLFKHYRALVKPAEAEAWWAVRPSACISEEGAVPVVIE